MGFDGPVPHHQWYLQHIHLLDLQALHAERSWLISQDMHLRRSLTQQQQQQQEAELEKLHRQVFGLQQALAQQQDHNQALRLQQHGAAKAQASQAQHSTAVSVQLTAHLRHEQQCNMRLHEQLTGQQQQQLQRSAGTYHAGLPLSHGGSAHQVGFFQPASEPCIDCIQISASAEPTCSTAACSPFTAPDAAEGTLESSAAGELDCCCKRR